MIFTSNTRRFFGAISSSVYGRSGLSRYSNDFPSSYLHIDQFGEHQSANNNCLFRDTIISSTNHMLGKSTWLFSFKQKWI